MKTNYSMVHCLFAASLLLAFAPLVSGTLEAAAGARGARGMFRHCARRARAGRGSRTSGLDGRHAPTTGSAIPIGLSNDSQ